MLSSATRVWGLQGGVQSYFSLESLLSFHHVSNLEGAQRCL